MTEILLSDSRKHVRGSITRLHNDLVNFADYNSSKLMELKLKFKKLDDEIISLNEKYLHELYKDPAKNKDKIALEYMTCEQYADKIIECQCAIDSQLATQQDPAAVGNYFPAGGGGVGGGAGGFLRSQLRSPIAPLPKFCSTEGENFNLFISQFEETLSKFSYTPYDKLLLLKQQVSGRALLLIDSLDPDKQSYEAAKQLLTSALASVEMQKYNAIKQLSELKLLSTGEPFQFIADVRKLMHSFDSLKITTENIFSYFVYSGLNDQFKYQMTLITNNTKPSIQKILDNFFKANERYEFSKK